MSSYKIGYARVITLQQDAALQRDALHAAGVDRILLDKASGKLESRPALDDRLEQARPGDILRGRNLPDQFNDGPFVRVRPHMLLGVRADV